VRLQVGSTYEWGHQSARSLVYLCLEECETETIRGTWKEPGYKLLCLVGADGYAYTRVAPGDVLIVPQGAFITVGVRRLA